MALPADDALDMALAGNEKNLDCLRALNARKPESINEALRVRRESARLCFQPSGPEFCGSLTTGIVGHTLQELGPTRAFENYMLSADNRDGGGMLLVEGETVPGYYAYDAIAKDLNPAVQASRSTAPLDPRWFVEKCPGTFDMLCEVLSYLRLPTSEWKARLAGFHGLIADGTHQLSFAWHCDCEDVRGLPSDIVTAVVQCSDATTGMRLLGHGTFLYSRGRVAIFPGLACHQSIPRADSSGLPVVKAVYFLRQVLKARVLKCPSSKPSAVLLGSLWPPASCPLWKSCLQFVLERRALEFIEEGLELPEAATGETVGSDSITTVNGSALSGLWIALKRRCKYGDYGEPEFYVEYGNFYSEFIASTVVVTGIVWFSALNAHDADMYRIAAFKGGGAALLGKFCAMMRARGFRQLRVAMKICILKRGAWLQSLGWREHLGRAGTNVRDGDVLTFDLQDNPLNGDDQARPTKRLRDGSHGNGWWPDGRPIPRHHPSPRLKPEYALAMKNGEKTSEGRPIAGFARNASVDDKITFTVSGCGSPDPKLEVRIIAVKRYKSWRAMLEHYDANPEYTGGLGALLPASTGFTGGVEEAVAVYHELRNYKGVRYEELQKEGGVVALRVSVTAFEHFDRVNPQLWHGGEPLLPLQSQSGEILLVDGETPVGSSSSSPLDQEVIQFMNWEDALVSYAVGQYCLCYKPCTEVSVHLDTSK